MVYGYVWGCMVLYSVYEGIGCCIGEYRGIWCCIGVYGDV